MGEAELSIILLSARVALVAILAALVPAFAVAWLLARKRFPGKGLLQALVTLPLVLPPVVTGYGLLVLFGAKGPLGRFFEQVFGLQFAFRWTGAALAAAVMAFPLLVRPIRLSLEAIDQGYAEAARTLGASRLTVFLTVTLPLALPGVIAGAVLGFAKALGEFGATITFVSNIPGETQTLSLAIYALLQTPSGDAAALRLILIAIAIALAAIVASEILARRLTREETR
ncbi:molybdate ABC transporter permease subunit [Nitratireductor pacificus]|uniref:Molybdenum transport system permease n=1 Tax=Nitratireductor pacificus pht-3B TaxID=391937 RepID=K2MYG5_9HYPH|nr:molybdate ABC transporter permease subunit [Nitratireductor pacificus]EKF17018.1 molybdate ABC transporter permease protein [Nitratireductor pacificus pht-3B]